MELTKLLGGGGWGGGENSGVAKYGDCCMARGVGVGWRGQGMSIDACISEEQASEQVEESVANSRDTTLPCMMLQTYFQTSRCHSMPGERWAYKSPVQRRAPRPSSAPTKV